MTSEAPPFWWTKADWRAWGLSPFSLLYGSIAGYRMSHGARVAIPVPVLCVGNFTVGGAGKTPTALALAAAARASGLKPGFLSRGYGGTLDVTTRVDPSHHLATAVGDEPLLLAQEAATVISRRRIEGAKKLVEEGVDFIIMDDGFQSARLEIDYALLVIDTMRGIGNGHIVPGGPVRAPLGIQLRYASALLKVGSGNAADRIVRMAARAGKPFFAAHLETRPNGDLSGRKVLAFAGIADPDKFYRTVTGLGAEIVSRHAFGDHQPLADDEAKEMLEIAGRESLSIVTTAKDAVRFAGRHGPVEELAAKARVIEVDMVFADPQAPKLIISQTVENFRKRRLKKS